jgi:hypothetical protein
MLLAEEREDHQGTLSITTGTRRAKIAICQNRKRQNNNNNNNNNKKELKTLPIYIIFFLASLMFA